MNTHQCIFKHEKRKDAYVCSVCNLIHNCGIEKCDSLAYNKEQTQVCTKTGRCFEQRLCDDYVDFSCSLDVSDPIYTMRVKRDQQIKNKNMNVNFILKLLESLEVLKQHPRKQNTLAGQIVKLWKEFVEINTLKGNYTHRADKRSFVVCIIKYMQEGLLTNKGTYIVYPHKDFDMKKLNRKSKYKDFKVSDIRKGYNLIKKTFADVEIQNPVIIC
jgi:hypothetical protein